MSKSGIHKPYLALVAALFVFVLVPGTSAAQTVTYQRGDGKGSVSETDDAELQAGSPNSNFGAGTALSIDGNPHQHVVLKFPNIFGVGANQIPPGSTINSATLTVRVSNASNRDPTVYQIIESWVESQVTWNSRSTGVSWTNAGADGTGSRKATAEGDFPMGSTGVQSMDVTTSVQNWSNGEANEGWVFIDNSNNDAAFDSSENATIANRPQLTVNYTPPGPRLSSATDQTFTVGDPPTAAAMITVTDASVAPTITAANDIRIRIPASFTMTWDTSVTSVTIGGGAAGKVSTSLLPYEDGGKTVVLDVTSNFAVSEQITVTGLRFTSFTAPSIADNLELEVNNDGMVSALDDKTITIVPPGPVCTTYQRGDGKGSVSETDDAELQAGSPNSNFGAGTALSIDGNPHQHVVLKFPNIFGVGANQIPPGSTINSATLTVRVSNASNRDPTVYQIIESWVESQVTWNSRSTGVSWTNAGADGTGSRKATAEGDFPMGSTGVQSMDVTTSVQNWSNGEANEGWVFIDNSNNDAAFDSSENATIANRPQLTVCRIPPAVDHYAISHSGLGVTCEAEPVTVRAHDGGHLAVAPGVTTTITGSTTPNADQWALRVGTGVFVDLGSGQFSYTFAAGETAVGLWLTRTTAAVIDIDIVDGSGNNEDASEDPSLDFRDTAFRFYADGVANTIGTQISRKENDVAPGVQAMTLRAVQTSTDTGACEARLTGPQVVDMAFECDNPNTCVAGQTVTVTGAPSVTIPGNPDGSVTSYANVNLTFDATGTAPFTFNYTDAGRIALHARKDLPATPPDPAITLTGASNDFVARPAGLCVESTDANSDCAAGDNSCSAFVKAGTSAFADSRFNLTISAVGWETSGETNADFCTGNIVTPNFRLNTIGLTHAKIAPTSGGVAGSLGVSSVDMVAADSGQHTVTNQAISEVGVFTITVVPPAYLGATIATSTSVNIGRFYPDRFSVTPNGPTFAHGCVAGTFTYTDQTFYYGTAPELTVTALNTAGATTVNYSGPAAPDPDRFWMLATTLPGRNYTDQAGAAATFNLPILGGAVTLANEQDFDGNGTLTMTAGMAGDDFSYQRVTPELPFPALVDLNFLAAELTDPDGACYDPDNNGTCDDFNINGITGTELRFGRLVIQNRFGSEVLPLPVPMRAEYFVDAATGFATNTADTCTTLTDDYLDLVSDIDDPPLGASPATINIGAGTSTGTIGNAPMAAGDAGQSFSTPGADNSGHVDIEANLTAPAMAQPPLPWLMYDWDGIDQGGDGNIYDDHPTGRGTFGVYGGSGRHIYVRELY